MNYSPCIMHVAFDNELKLRLKIIHNPGDDTI